jgi:hypothetical protein
MYDQPDEDTTSNDKVSKVHYIELSYIELMKHKSKSE